MTGTLIEMINVLYVSYSFAFVVKYDLDTPCGGLATLDQHQRIVRSLTTGVALGVAAAVGRNGFFVMFVKQ